MARMNESAKQYEITRSLIDFDCYWVLLRQIWPDAPRPLRAYWATELENACKRLRSLGWTESNLECRALDLKLGR